MKNRYDIDDFYKSVLENLDHNEKELIYPGYFYRALYEGDNRFYQQEKIESRKFDDLWIKTIESYFPSINRITINLKSTLKYQSEIIPIEKTKKINKESVIHLMSHSNFIKEISDEGVIPKQILSILPEIDYGIYENRFIMTLINRLRDFVNKRVKTMRQKIKASKIIHMNINSEFKFEESDFQMSVDIKQIQDINQRKIDEHNVRTLERGEKLLKLISRLQTTQFMKVLQRYKPVKSPIMKTQIILSNSDFKNAYLLWLYLDYYNDLGYDLNIRQTNKRFTKAYTKNINKSLMMMCTTLLANDKSAKSGSITKYQAEYKEKAAKTVKKLPIEIDIEPIAYEIEDVGLNEFYYVKNKQILKKQFEDLIKEGSSYKVALKKALTDTLSITEALYESFFQVNADEDIFQQLIKEEDPEKDYKEAYDKYLISCTLREVKERDFKRSMSLEKKWQEELRRYHKKLIEFKGEEIEKKNEDIIEELKVKCQDKLDVISAREYREKQSLMRKHKMETDVLRKNLSREYSKKIKELRESADKKLRADRQKVNEQAKIKKLKEEARHKEELQMLQNEHKERMAQLEQQLREKFMKDKEALQLKAKESLAKQKETIKIQNEKRRANEKEKKAQQKQSAMGKEQNKKEELKKKYALELDKEKQRLKDKNQKELEKC